MLVVLAESKQTQAEPEEMPETELADVLNNGVREKTQKEESKKEQECPAARCLNIQSV